MAIRSGSVKTTSGTVVDVDVMALPPELVEPGGETVQAPHLRGFDRKAVPVAAAMLSCNYVRG
jgi:hypothetical protein